MGTMLPPAVFDRAGDDFPEPHMEAEPQCRRCGSTEVRWRLQTGRWVLFSLKPGVEHRCELDGDALAGL